MMGTRWRRSVRKGIKRFLKGEGEEEEEEEEEEGKSV
jgi:hypothetical protein